MSAAESRQTAVVGDLGGDAACWLDTVCDRCGALIDPAEPHRCRLPATGTAPDGLIRGIDHLGLTVRDADASAAWYARVLDFERVGEYESPDGARRKVFLRHRGFAIRLGLTQHDGATGDEFDETRVGLDHLAFAVGDHRELELWMSRLSTAGVTHSPIAPANSLPGALVLVFRDPDNIQLELIAQSSEADR